MGSFRFSRRLEVPPKPLYSFKGIPEYRRGERCKSHVRFVLGTHPFFEKKKTKKTKTKLAAFLAHSLFHILATLVILLQSLYSVFA